MKTKGIFSQDKIAAVNNWVTDEALCYGRYEPFDEETYQLLIQRIIDEIGHTKCLFVDIGCGTGAFAFRLAAKGFKIVGVDLSHKMLELAQENCGRPDRVSFVRADVEQLPFLSETFDAVLCFALHHHFLAYGKLASEVTRVMKSTGRLFVCDPNGINPHIALLMHPASPVRYSSLSPNQKPIRPSLLQEEYGRCGVQLRPHFISLKVRPRPVVRRDSFWFRPRVYKYIGFVMNSIKEPWRYLPAIILFNLAHATMRFMPGKYRSNYVFLIGKRDNSLL
jgi:ubiquinone/menaquinone biosynthesis C-methylase UbiE